MTEKRDFSVLLDLDDTVFDFKKAEAIALGKTLRGLGIEPTEERTERYSEINIAMWEKLELGILTREEVLTGRFERFFNELGVEASGYEAQLTYESLLSEGHYYMPGAEELLTALYGKYRLYLVSNGCASVQAGRLASAGIAPLFDGIFISEEIGAEKPSREYFDRCFRNIPDFDRSRALIVGDSLTSDIRGGINAGIKTCWYNYRRRSARADIVPDFTVTSLAELPPLLERLAKA